MYMNKIFKGSWAVACACVALSVQAQSLQQVAPLSTRMQAESEISPLQVASRNLPTFKAQAGKVVNVNHMNATSSQRFQKNARISGTNNQKPGTSYAVNKGVYNLVSGIALGQDGNGQAVYAEGGVLAYIDRPLTFHNTTPLCDEFSWAFGGSTYTEDSLSMRPYFPNNGFYFDTPVLTATLGSADSTYQLGAHIDATTHKKVPGMVAASLMAYVYNVDADATPFVDTYYTTMSSTDPWNNVLFGADNTYKSSYVEWFDAPTEGGIMLWGTHFYVMTPASVDLSNKTFQIDWVEVVGEEDKKLRSFQAKPELNQSTSSLRLWDINVNTETPTTLVKNEFYVMITGPQDGTKWALMHQLNRAELTNPDKNTAYYVPTTGEFAGKLCQYVFIATDTEGKEYEFTYNTSLDIHMFVATPYIIMSEDDATATIVQQDELELNIDGETHNYLLMDWFGTASSGTTISASISESTDGDWLTVTQPVQAGTDANRKNYFSMSLKAMSKDWLLEGRRATLTLKDDRGFSRDIVVYQGDRDAADDALSISEINAAGKISASYANGKFTVTYPTDYVQVKVYTLSGQQVDSHVLSGNGKEELSAAALTDGVYLLQFVGKDIQTVKVMK